MTNAADTAQARMMLENIADAAASAAIMRYRAEHLDVPKVEMPAPLKWAAAIVAALFVAGIGGTATWLITTVNEMLVTLARMDERQANQTNSQDGRFGELERRIGRLERFHEEGGE